jgi:DNA mismatch repair protein MutL
MTEESAIRRLDDRTVERIAAGEVVERPASVVKELVENSLDADAGRIDVTVVDGGTTEIRVADDGVGMSAADVRRAVEQHTTSKIRDIGDLESGVATLGFRGEALHTVGAVSRTTITTRPRGGDRATELRLEGGDVTHVRPAGRPEGTTVRVEDLFFNVPARRKYLKSESTEFARVNRVVTRYALANPDVAVSLAHGDREVFATTGQGDLRATLLSVYGREVAESMVEIEGSEARSASGRASGEERSDDPRAEPDAPIDGVRGYVSHPETTRSTRDYVSTFVNGRYVRDSTLRDAVVSAYGGQLAADRFPFAVVFVDVPADEVDVNVHPRKMEVRWEHEAGVRDAVASAVERALLDHGLLRRGAPRGRSAPDDARVEPAQPGDGAASDSTDDGRGGPAASASAPDVGEADASARGAASRPDAGGRERRERRAERDDDPHWTPDPDADAGWGEADPEAGRDPDRKFRAPTANDRLVEDDAGDGEAAAASESDDSALAPDHEFDSLPPMRVLGQVQDTYVVAETPDGLVLVDQHAADERVNYERLVSAVADRRASQTLVAPVELELTAAEAAAFDDALPDLRELGFEARLVDGGEGGGRAGDGRAGARTAAVTAVPAVFADALDPDLLRDVLASLVGGDAAHGETVESAADALLADMACYPSITGNTSLSEGDVVGLLQALDDCENPWACPHGRPVVVAVSRQEIEDRFERDYPGHQVRRPEE